MLFGFLCKLCVYCLKLSKRYCLPEAKVKNLQACMCLCLQNAHTHTHTHRNILTVIAMVYHVKFMMLFLAKRYEQHQLIRTHTNIHLHLKKNEQNKKQETKIQTLTHTHTLTLISAFYSKNTRTHSL